MAIIVSPMTTSLTSGLSIYFATKEISSASSGIAEPFDNAISVFINIKILFMVLKEDKLAAFLYTPYIVWLLFA